MPQGTKYRPGELLGRYRIEGELGAGYTAWVYRAVDTSTGEEVALKVRKPGLPPAMQARFRLEATVLSELRAAEAKPEYRIEGTLGTTLEELSATGIQLGEDHSFIVGLRGMDLEHDPPYIALELLRGKTVIGWLMERGYLEEREALRIGWQFCHVLRLLHEDLHRSYTDMKLDNIWWDGEWIKVIDWNIVSPVGEADVGQDLLAFGKHLYRMVTGVMLDPGAKGYGADRLEVLSAGRWDELSEGMRQVLRRALHRNEGRRYPDAQALGRDLWGLARAWSPAAYTGDELVMEAWKLLDQEEDVDAVRKALALLDVARRRGDGPAEAIEQWWGVAWQRVGVQERAISRGEAFWRAGDYRSAEGALLEAIEEGEEELTAWRLLGLVRLGVERPIEVRGVQERIDEGLEALKGGWYDRAEKLFGEVNGRLGEAGVIEDLEREARVRRLVEEGDEAEADKRYSEAAEAYSGAWDELQAMGSEGYREVLAAELPDLKVAAGQAHQRDKSLEEPARLLERGRQYLGTSVEKATDLFYRGLQIDPHNESIIQECLSQAKNWVRKGTLEPALAFLAAAQVAPGLPGVRAAYQAVWHLQEAEQLFTAGRFVEAGREALEVLSLAEKTHISSLLQQKALPLFQRSFDAALQAEDLEGIGELMAVAQVKRPFLPRKVADTIDQMIPRWHEARLRDLRTRLSKVKRSWDLDQCEEIQEASSAFREELPDGSPLLEELKDIVRHVGDLYRELQEEAQERQAYKEFKEELALIEAVVESPRSSQELEAQLKRCEEIEDQVEKQSWHDLARQARALYKKIEQAREQTAAAEGQREEAEEKLEGITQTLNRVQRELDEVRRLRRGPVRRPRGQVQAGWFIGAVVATALIFGSLGSYLANQWTIGKFALPSPWQRWVSRQAPPTETPMPVRPTGTPTSVVVEEVGPTASALPTSTARSTQTPTEAPAPTLTATATPTGTPTKTATPTPTNTPTPGHSDRHTNCDT